MSFDPTKITEVETMTSTDFAVWRTSKQNEIAASQAAGSSFNHAARTMMTLSVNAYVDAAYTLREVCILDPSQRVDGFTADRKGDILRQLRKQYENGRKMFTFAIANASKNLYPYTIQFTLKSPQVTDCQPLLKLLKSPTPP